MSLSVGAAVVTQAERPMAEVALFPFPSVRPLLWTMSFALE